MTELLDPGYIGLFLAGFLAATVIPFSSEVLFSTMLYGDYDFTLCLFSASAGNTMGGMSSYLLGYLVKWHWLEKYMNIRMEKVKSLHSKIKDRIAIASLLCWLPVIGDPIAVALGFMRAPALKVLLFMFTGKFLRYLALGLFTLKIIKI
jgi:membrane protein YqaA with SNARE-associated domain